ncbi:MAG: polysaccharide biosynthesis C-terminal domain-containing protein, partial [Romboutsia timonensis]|uniref:polysaccharide biosynthesis C-terminal domain-containing protein n=1 Tax=Romboutsia timonensis TaxID=1776391 RepID=UPI002A75AC6E
VGACINLVFNLFLIPIFGALGATIATVITETVVAGIQLFHSRDNIIIVFKKLQYLKILSAVSIALIILNLTKYYLHANDFIQIVITFSVYIIAYFSLLLIFKDSFVCNYFKVFVNRIRK